MGFLQSVFERFIPDNILIAEALEARGVSGAGAVRLAETAVPLPNKPTALTIDADSNMFGKDNAVAVKALDYLQKKIGRYGYVAFELKNLSFGTAEEENSGAVLNPPVFHAKKIALFNCNLSKKNLSNFLSGVDKTAATTLEIENTNCSGVFDALTVCGDFRDLSLKNANPDKDDLNALAKILPNTALTRFVLNEKNPSEEGLKNIINALPASLSVLNLSSCPVNGAVVEVLANKLAELKQVEIIDLSGCALSAPNVAKLANVLPPSVRNLNLESAEISDDALNALLKSAKRPESMLYETNIVPTVTSVAHPDPRYSQPLGAELTMAEFANKQKYMEKTAREKAALIAAQKTSAPAKATFGLAGRLHGLGHDL